MTKKEKGIVVEVTDQLGLYLFKNGCEFIDEGDCGVPHQSEEEFKGIPDDLKRLMQIVDNYWGSKAINTSVQIKGKSLFYICYGSFELRFSLGERYGEFGASIAMGNGHVGFITILGDKMSLNSDEKSVIENLKIIDEYCRLRLPDKYLKEFDTRTY